MYKENGMKKGVLLLAAVFAVCFAAPAFAFEYWCSYNTNVVTQPSKSSVIQGAKKAGKLLGPKAAAAVKHGQKNTPKTDAAKKKLEKKKQNSNAKKRPKKSIKRPEKGAE